MSGGLIVTADDLGLTAGISDGILEAHEHGIVTAASLMATGTDFERAVSRLAEHPALDVGVHLALDEERPLLEGLRTIVGADGAFLTRGKLLLRLALRRVDLDEVEAVWDAEFLRIVAAGLRPSFVNSHGHVHGKKYSAAEIVALLDEAGYSDARVFRDSANSFVSTLPVQ